MSDILQVQGINTKGFGMIPKLVMQDKRLTAEAKAIYGYFCSYAGAGRTAFPSRDRIVADLGMSKSRFYRHYNLLKKYGYIQVEQERKNQFKRNIYTLLESVPCPHYGYTQNEDTQNRDMKNNIIKNKQSFKNISQSCQFEKPDGQDKDMTDDIEQKIETYYELIKENISYNDLVVTRPYDMKLVDEIIAIIVDTVMTEGKTVRIGGEDKPRALVTGSLLKLSYDDIELVIDQFKRVTDRISKKKQYILTMLYNAKLEGDSHYTNLVKYDQWNGSNC